jgi:4-hydroxy-tetrahydrodipicolinate synthase
VIDPLPSGLIHIVITPFHEDGAVDFASLERLTESALDEGASALTALGVTSEAALLSEDERDAILTRIQRVNTGRVPIVVGITAPDATTLAVRAAKAQMHGAAAVMVAPSPHSADLLAHYAEVAEAVPGLPIVLQDFPAISGGRTGAGTLARVARTVDAIVAVYHEDPPTSAKIAAVLQDAPNVMQIGGLGALWLPWELQAGAQSVMTGFAFPEYLAAIVSAAHRGDWVAVHEIHAIALPLIAWEAQPGVGLAHRKAMLVQRGLIETATMRLDTPPTPRAALDAAALQTALVLR